MTGTERRRKMGWRDDDFVRSEREYLPYVFELLFDREFDYNELKDRRLMQEAMMIAQCRGVSIGEYSWSRYKVGMYSQGLQDDLYENYKGVEKKHLPEEWVMTLGCIRGILRWGEEKYGLDEWAKCLSDVWYVYDCRMCNPLVKEKVVNEVKKYVKDYPSDEMLEDAFDCCEKLKRA